jgi:putative oxidoreductase
LRGSLIDRQGEIMKKLYALYISLVSRLQSPFLLIIRLYWGWQFFVSGKAHLTHLSQTTDFFQSLHIPMPKVNAIMAGSTECVGGLLLLLGLGSRIITIPLVFTMVIAYLTADSDKVKGIFTNPDAFVTAAPFLFMLTAIIVLIFGPGCFSLDAMIARMCGEKKK